MDELKQITASNIIALRTKAGMTQLELAEKLNYSDKSVSKWERADAIPDAYVLKQMAEIFGVTVDELLTAPGGAAAPHVERKAPIDLHTSRTITTLTIVGVWTLALLAFVICWLCGDVVWLIFVYAVPVSLVTMLVLHSVWEGGKYNYWIIGALIVSILATIYLTGLERNWWQIFLLVVPAGAVVFLSSRLKK